MRQSFVLKIPPESPGVERQQSDDLSEGERMYFLVLQLHRNEIAQTTNGGARKKLTNEIRNFTNEWAAQMSNSGEQYLFIIRGKGFRVKKLSHHGPSTNIGRLSLRRK